jgi:Bacterial Ig domain/Fibronectin type III domain
MPSPSHRPRSRLSAITLISGLTLMGSLAHAVDVQLAWDPSPSPQVTGYQLYYGTASGSYSVHVDTGPVTTAALSGLAVGQTYYFAATAYDSARNESPFSNEVRYTTAAGDTTPPTVTLTAPLNGAVVPRKSTVTIRVTATDNVGVTTVAFYVDGRLTCATGTAPYTCAWEVPAAARRSYQLQATAVDAQDNVGASPHITVTAE